MFKLGEPVKARSSCNCSLLLAFCKTDCGLASQLRIKVGITSRF